MALASLVVGVIVYSFIEYAVHRWILHGPMLRKHSVHHQRPSQHEGVPIKIVGMAFALSWLLVGLAFALGIAIAWGVSSALHRRLHIGTPELSWLLRLRAHHDGHHRNASTNYGVTNTLWDKVFQTEGNSGAEALKPEKRAIP